MSRPAAEEGARPALPRRREHARRDRAARRARPRGRRARDRARASACSPRYLADRTAHVHAVELDRSLEPRLREALEGRDNVELHFGDALRLDLAALEPAPTKLVSNLPYNIATPLVVESLDGLPSVELWCVMVQREVADRFFAEPSTKAYGAVSVLVQLAAERTGFHPVSRTVFRPRPNVDSALVAFRRRELPASFAAREAARRARPSPTGARRSRTRSSSPASPPATRRRRRSARSAASRPRAPRSSRRPSSSPSRKRSAREPRAGDREAQPRARRRAAARRRQARGRHRPAAHRPRRPRRDRAGAGASGRGLPGRHARPLGARAPRRGRGRRAALARARSGSASPSRPASAAAARTPRPRCRLANETLPEPLPPERLHELAAELGADVPFFLTSGPQLGTGTGTELEPLELPQDYWVVLLLPRGRAQAVDRRRLRATSTDATAREGFEERRARLHEALAAVEASARPGGAAAERPRLLAARRAAARARRLPRRRERRRAGRLRALPAPRAGRRGRARAAAARAHLDHRSDLVRLTR